MSNIILSTNKILSIFSDTKKFTKKKFYSFLYRKPWFFNNGLQKFDYLEKQNKSWFYYKEKSRMNYSISYWNLRNKKLELEVNYDINKKKNKKIKMNKKKKNKEYV